METWIYWIGMAGTIAFVLTGVLVVAPKGIDLFSATVMGIITAVREGIAMYISDFKIETATAYFWDSFDSHTKKPKKKLV